MKGERTSTLALVIAGILLLGVGAYSYHDYVESKLEKEFAEKEMALGQERELLHAYFDQSRRCRELGIPIFLRYLVTVRRATFRSCFLSCLTRSSSL